mgnify:CR=1 FL=1
MEDLRDFVSSKEAFSGVGEGLGEKQEVCEKHGTYTSKGMRWLGKKEIWSGCPQCKAEQQAEEDHRDRLDERARSQHHRTDQAQHHQREILRRSKVEGEFR